MGLNQFMILTPREFKEKYLTTKVQPLGNHGIPVESDPPRNLQETRGAIDWVAQGKVSPVKNQGDCGCCYTFSTTSGIESANLMAENELVLLS